MTLKELPIGKMATVLAVGGEGALRQHFLDMGIIPSAQVTMVKYAPMGDPVEVRIHSYELTLRLADAEKIEIGQIQDAVTKTRTPNQIVSLCRYVILILPLAFLLSHLLGAAGVWHAFWLTETITAIISLLLYQNGIKKA